MHGCTSIITLQDNFFLTKLYLFISNLYLAFAVVVDHKSFSLKLISLGRYATSIILNIFISSENSYFGQLCFLIGYNLKLNKFRNHISQH
jgi:hypothetical protein